MMKINNIKFFGCFNVAKLFLYLFFAFLPFQIDALVLNESIYFSGFFNPYLSHFIYASDVFFILSLLFFAFSLLFQNYIFKDFKFTVGDKWLTSGIILFMFTAIFSLIFASNFVNSLFYCVRGIEFFIVYLLVANKFINLKILFGIFIGVVSFEALIGIYQYIFQESFGLSLLGEPNISFFGPGVSKVDFLGNKLVRAYGTFSHPNIFAGYLSFSIIFIIYFLQQSLNSKNKLIKFSLLFLLIICLISLIFSFSRSAIIGLFIGVIVYLILTKKKENKKSFLEYILFLLLLIFGFCVLFRIFPNIIYRFSFSDSSNFSERLLYMSISKDMFLSNIFGVGIGNFTDVMQNISQLKLMSWQFQPVHNMFLLLLNEVGIQGFIVFVVLFFGWFFKLIVKFRREKDVEKRKYVGLIISLWIVLFVIGLFDHYFISLYQGQALFLLFLIL